jgi:cytochrome bd-type quinol oxidase subunit 2
MNPYGQVAGVTSEDQAVQSGTPQEQTANTQTTDQTNTYQTAASPDTSGISYNGDTVVDSFTLSQAFGFFNILAGLMLVAGLVLFFGGFIAYLTRLGLESRTQGLRYMYWGETVLFVLILMLAVVHYLQFHPTIVFILIGALIVLFGSWAILQAVANSGDEEEH